MSKYLSKLMSFYEEFNISPKSEECEECNKLADEFHIVHQYEHPSTKKKCYCMMRKHPMGYNIIDIDEDGKPVVDIFGPQSNDETHGNDEEAESGASNPALRPIFGAPINPTEIALVKTLAGDTARGGIFSNPQKDMEKAYGTLISKLAGKIKTVANSIK